MKIEGAIVSHRRDARIGRLSASRLESSSQNTVLLQARSDKTHLPLSIDQLRKFIEFELGARIRQPCRP